MSDQVELAWDVWWSDDGGEHRTTRRQRYPTCSVCGGALTCGQPGRHWSCSPTCTSCHRPYGPTGENCVCAGGPGENDP